MLEEIKSHIKNFTAILEGKGYDNSEIKSIIFSEDQIGVSYTAIDDFQRDLPTEFKVAHGHFESIHEPTIEECYKTLAALPGRKMRELQVLARQTAGIGKHLEELQSEQARAFAQEIFDSVATLHDAIEDQRGNN